MKKRTILIGISAVLITLVATWGIVRIQASRTQPATTLAHADSTVSPSLYLTGTQIIPTVKVSSSTANCPSKKGQGSTGENGSPLIKPHLCGTPTFTEQDVRAYMRTVKSFSSFRIRQLSPHYTITRILFVTNKVANDILNADTGAIDDNLIVCYVEIYGDFTVEGGPAGIKPHKPVILHHGQLTINAVTGQGLSMGVEQ